MLPTFNVPPIGPRQGKVWGTTQLGFAYNGTEAHGIVVTKGGYCSRHSHRTKWNRFQVLSGQLEVLLFRTETEYDKTIIGAGQITDVPPGIVHAFEALEDTIAVEYYWTVLDTEDIDRHGTEGGTR